MTEEQQKSIFRQTLVLSGVAIVLFLAVVSFILFSIKNDKEARERECVETRGVVECYMDAVFSD